jgi:flagellar basal-body rod protein FlgG
MTQALWIAMSGLEAQQTRMSVVSNNLANVATTGFKRARPIFEDLLYQNVRQVGAQSTENTELPSGLMVGTGVRMVATEKLFTQGTLVQTDNSLDMALNGRGFFQVLLPDGNIGYTRDGSFHLNGEGQVVTSDGNPLEPAIEVPQGAQSITIGTDGTMSIVLAGDSSPTQVGSIETADFINPGGLQPIGDNLYVESVSSGASTVGTPGLDGFGSIRQGYVESSNVNVVEELINMIEVQRAYEMNSKAISATDEMLRYVNNQL